MSETITVDNVVYDLSKTSEESAQAVRGLSRVIQKTQSIILDHNDNLLIAQTSLKCEFRWSPAEYKKARQGEEDIEPSFKPKADKLPKPKDGEISAIVSRCLTLPTVKKFNVKVVKDEHGDDIKHYYPYYIGETEEAIKIRDVGIMVPTHFTGLANLPR